MKNKIQRFSKGDFSVEQPEVVFEETNLVMIIGEGEVYRGSFLIKSNNDRKIRGILYPSSFRIHFKDQGFDFDLCYTSVLKRAIPELNLLMMERD